jgi:RloB-like protein
MARHTSQGGPPRRGRGGSSVRRKELLVFTEGLRTEVQYINFWHRLYREKIIVTISEKHGEPLTLVRLALAARDREQVEERRSGGKARDEYWCVFDRDVHPHFKEAVDLARKEGIKLAVSNPCIELWFLWHFDDCNTHIERHEAQRRAKDYLKCDKNLSDDALNQLGHDTRYADASTRARNMEVKHQGDGSPAGSNPSSTMAALIDRIRLRTPDA